MLLKPLPVLHQLTSGGSGYVSRPDAGPPHLKAVACGWVQTGKGPGSHRVNNFPQVVFPCTAQSVRTSPKCHCWKYLRLEPDLLIRPLAASVR